MKKREWLVGMAFAVASFTLIGCSGKENKQKALASEIEDTSVGVCPCCEAEFGEMSDTDTATMVMFVDGI